MSSHFDAFSQQEKEEISKYLQKAAAFFTLVTATITVVTKLLNDEGEKEE